MKKIIKLAIFGIAISTLVISCKKLENTIKEKINGPEFNIDSFEQNIINALDGRAVGYSYCISQAGTVVKKGSGGFAVSMIDLGGGVPHNYNKRQEIASCSKTITALALLSIMQETGMTGDEKLSEYLPENWILGNATKNVTIKNLLQHESGFPGGGLGYDDLKAFSWQNTKYTQGSYDYANVNYAFLRLVIAYASPTAGLAAYEKSITVFGTILPNNEKKLDSAISQIYIDEVNKRVFQPSGIKYSRPTSEGETSPTLNYNFNNVTPGYMKGDMTRYVGSTGWRLSAIEQNAIMVYLKHTEKILNEQWRTKMNNELLGWSSTSSQEVTGGMAYMHGGYHCDSFGMPDIVPPVPLNRGCFAVQVLFPNNIECALQVNSIGGTSNMENTVVPCYENAWIDN